MPSIAISVVIARDPEKAKSSVGRCFQATGRGSATGRAALAAVRSRATTDRSIFLAQLRTLLRSKRSFTGMYIQNRTIVFAALRGRFPPHCGRFPRRAVAFSGAVRSANTALATGVPQCGRVHPPTPAPLASCGPVAEPRAPPSCLETPALPIAVLRLDRRFPPSVL